MSSSKESWTQYSYCGPSTSHHPHLYSTILRHFATDNPLIVSQILFIQAVPALRSRFLAYGSRASSPATHPEKPSNNAKTTFDQFLDYLATWQVPHSYFIHFYVVSVLSSVFWAWSLKTLPPDPQVTPAVGAAWFLMFFQGGRRLMECYLMAPSKSKMWIGHWVLGVLFYLTINVSIWIEEADVHPHQIIEASLWKRKLVPWLIIPMCMGFQQLQTKIHAHFNQLRASNSGYQLPDFRPYSWLPDLLCPHYTCEVLIYLSLSLIAAPAGRVVNWTVLAATVLVAVNLGVTASGTKVWYEKQFGKKKVRHRKRMVPWVW